MADPPDQWDDRASVTDRRPADVGGAALSRAFDEAVVGMAIVDPDGRYRLVNPALCRMLGRAAEDLIGRSTTELTHPEDAERTRRQRSGPDGWARADQARKRYLRPDGTVVSALRTTTVLRDDAGRPQAMFVQVLDLSDAAGAEAARERSERRLQALLARSSELTVVLDPEGTILYASPASVQLLGYEPAEAEGHLAADFMHPEELDQAIAVFAGHLDAPGAPTLHEFRVLHRDGRWRQTEAVVTNLVGDPAISGIVVNLRDTTAQRQAQQDLAASEARFRSLVADSWDVITLHAPDGRYLYASPAITRELGYEPEDLVGLDPFGLIHPDDPHVAEEFARAAAGTRRNEEALVYRFRHRDGTWRWVESTAHNALDDLAVGGIVVTTRDVTQRVLREARQVALTTLSSEALRGVSLEALLAQATGLVADALGVGNVAVTRIVDGGRLEVVARHGPSLQGSHPLRIDGPPASLGASALQDGLSAVWRRDRPDTGHLPEAEALGLHSGAAALIADGPKPYGTLAAYSSRPDDFTPDDVSFLEAAANVLAAAVGRRRVEAELRDRALRDQLTGLPNRAAFLDRLAVAVSRLERQGGELAVLFVDTDDFKLVNDVLGHAAGDQVVVAVAEQIAGVLRASDTVARFGGDEFVVLCEGAGAPAAADVARRVHAALSAPIAVGDRNVTLTASIGIATTSVPTAPDDLMAQADTAMYAAKQAGKNRSVCFDRAMRLRVHERLEVLSGLREAIGRDELRLHYQPLVRTDSGDLIGVEALMRWQHPLEGLLAPDRFIPHAEETELIIPLGAWALAEACRRGAAWAGAGFAGTVSVNVSGRQLAENGFVATVERELLASGLAPRSLCLEVTESAVMADVERAAAAVHSVRALGVRVGVDDFGTGYSSLSYLANLEFDFIKIDRSFVARFDEDRRAAALLEAIASLCHSLDLWAVAEGVETERQLAGIRAMGIPFAQGYLFGRPVPADELRPRLVRGTAA